MSTRSAIVMKMSNGKYKGIYCHSDGYRTGVGKMLFTHYSGMVHLPRGFQFHEGRGKMAAAKVRALMALGGLSFLEENLAPPPGVPHTFDRPVDKVTVAYHRDRGESKKDNAASVGATVDEVIGSIDHAYFYVFDKGRWSCNGEPLRASDVYAQ